MSEVQPNKCWKCRMKIPQAIQLNTLDILHPPMPGDVSICRNCGAFSTFDGLLHTRKPTNAELRIYEADENICRAREQLVNSQVRGSQRPDSQQRGGRA